MVEGIAGGNFAGLGGGSATPGRSLTAKELRALETFFNDLGDALNVIALILATAAAIPEPGSPAEALGAFGAAAAAVLAEQAAKRFGEMARRRESAGTTVTPGAGQGESGGAAVPSEPGQVEAGGGLEILAGKLNAAVERLDDASVTFDALVQVFGEAVARIDAASRRLKEAMDGLLGPGDAPEEMEPGFRRASFRPASASLASAGASLASTGASAALLPVDGSLAGASRAVTGFVAESEGALGELGDFAGRVFGEIGDTLSGVLETGKVEWRDLARVAIGAIGDILAEQVKLLGDGSSGGGFFDLLGGILSGVLGGFGGAFAHGGRPAVGRAALVGEAGPELFIPDVPGTIIPDGMLAAGAGAPKIVTNFTIDARGAERGVERRIQEAIFQAEQRISQNVLARIVHSAQRGGLFARLPRR